jgi:hypothetical protein
MPSGKRGGESADGAAPGFALDADAALSSGWHPAVKASSDATHAILISSRV